MKIIKGSYIGDTISDLLVKFQKNMLITLKTNIYEEFVTLYFCGSGFDLVLDYTRKSIYIYASKQELNQYLNDKLNDSTNKKILSDIFTYLSWLKHSVMF